MLSHLLHQHSSLLMIEPRLILFESKVLRVIFERKEDCEYTSVECTQLIIRTYYRYCD